MFALRNALRKKLHPSTSVTTCDISLFVVLLGAAWQNLPTPSAIVIVTAAMDATIPSNKNTDHPSHQPQKSYPYTGFLMDAR
jgi:hypothetical protein